MDMATLISFEGCINRRTWWLTNAILLSTLIANECAGRYAQILPDFPAPTPDTSTYPITSAAYLLVTAMLLALMIPANTRRWHDRGKSGWWSLLLIVPVIGLVWIIVELGFGETRVKPSGLPPTGIVTL